MKGIELKSNFEYDSHEFNGYYYQNRKIIKRSDFSNVLYSRPDDAHEVVRLYSNEKKSNKPNDYNVDSITIKLSPNYYSMIVGDFDRDIMEFGEYPQSLSDDELSKKLESIYESLTSSSPEKIIPLKEEYTIVNNKIKRRVALKTYSHTYYHTGVINNKKTYKVYEYNGEKFIRYKNNKDIYWVKVEPIVWVIDRENRTLKTEKAIFNGILESYLYDASTWARGLSFLRMVQISEDKTNSFLSKYFIKDILQNVKLKYVVKYKNYDELVETIKNNNYYKEFENIASLEFEGPRLTNNEKDLINSMIGGKIKKSFNFLDLNEEEKISSKFKSNKKKMKESKEELEKKYNDILLRINELKKAIASFEKNKDIYSSMSKAFASSIRVPEELLLIEVDGHYEFNPNFIDVLTFIDLSYLKTKDLKLSGLDLSETNIHFNPQEIFNKDLSYSKLGDHNISWCSFKGVNLCHADIQDEKESYDFDLAITDNETKLPKNKTQAL